MWAFFVQLLKLIMSFEFPNTNSCQIMFVNLFMYPDIRSVCRMCGEGGGGVIVCALFTSIIIYMWRYLDGVPPPK